MTDKKNKQKQNQQTRQQNDANERTTAAQQGFSLDKVSDDQLREKATMLIDALTKENEQLIATQDSLQKQIEKGDEYLNQLVVLKSDFENFKRRNANIAEEKTQQGKLFVVEKMLPILDTFDKAKQMLSATEMATFDLIVRQFEKILAEVGVEKMDLLGQKFDPNTANAVHKIEVTEQESDETVVEVYANGYKFGDKILRYATVCVGKFEAQNKEKG